MSQPSYTEQGAGGGDLVAETPSLQSSHAYPGFGRGADWVPAAKVVWIGVVVTIGGLDQSLHPRSGGAEMSNASPEFKQPPASSSALFGSISNITRSRSGLMSGAGSEKRTSLRSFWYWGLQM